MDYAEQLYTLDADGARLPTLFELIPAVMTGIGAIAKDLENKNMNFKYRGIDQVIDAIHGPLVAARIILTQNDIYERNEWRQSKSGGDIQFATVMIRYTMWGPGGDSMSSQVSGNGMDSGNKALNKARSDAFKYWIFHTFAVRFEALPDGDADGSVETESAVQAAPKHIPRPRVSAAASAPAEPVPGSKGEYIYKIRKLLLELHLAQSDLANTLGITEPLETLSVDALHDIWLKLQGRAAKVAVNNTGKTGKRLVGQTGA